MHTQAFLPLSVLDLFVNYKVSSCAVKRVCANQIVPFIRSNCKIFPFGKYSLGIVIILGTIEERFMGSYLLLS